MALSGLFRQKMTKREKLQRIPIAGLLSAYMFAPRTGCCLLLTTPATVTQCMNPMAHKDPLRFDTSGTSLLPLSLPLRTTENQGGQGMVFIRSLKTDRGYSELDKSSNKVTWNLPLSHLKVTLSQKYMPHNSRVLLKDHVKIGSKNFLFHKTKK